MRGSLFWVPTAEGRVWWPAVLIKDRMSQLDQQRHAPALEFWQAQHQLRCNKLEEGVSEGAEEELDVLVLLFCYCAEEFNKPGNGHRFAVVPKASLRAFTQWFGDFSQGVCSSGRNLNRASKNAAERGHLAQVLARLQDQFLVKTKQQQQQQQPFPSSIGGGAKPVVAMQQQQHAYSSTPHPTTQLVPPPPPPPPPHPSSTGLFTSAPPFHAVSLLSPPPPPPPLPLLQAMPITPQQPTVPFYQPSWEEEESWPEVLHLVQQRDEVKRRLNAVQSRIAARAQSTAASAALLVEPSPCPTLTTEALRNWDFCYTFRHELGGLLKEFDQFPRLSSFDACLGSPECFLYAELCSQLVNFISIQAAGDGNNNVRINLENGNFAPNLGATCTRLSWPVLLQTLIKHNLVVLPSNANHRDCVDALITACGETELIRSAMRTRQMEYAAAAASLQHSGGGDNASSVADFARLERDVARGGGGGGGATTTQALLAEAMDKALAQINLFRLSKRVRNVSFGVDHEGRHLFLLAANEEEPCVWAIADNTTQWSVYLGEPVLERLVAALRARNRQKEVAIVELVLAAYRTRFRPRTSALYLDALAAGWRFAPGEKDDDEGGGDALLGRDLLKYIPGHGILVGRICARNVERDVFRIVFSARGEWSTGMDLTRAQIQSVLDKSTSSRLNAKYFLGDFEFREDDYQTIVGAGNWVKQDDSNDPNSNKNGLLVMVACPEKKVIALGVIIACSENGEFALVLADGGETVVLTPISSILRAQHQALNFNPSPFCTQFQPIERLHPLVHHSGELVGLAGVVNLFRKDTPVSSLLELRNLLLEFEEMYHDSMWQVEDVEQAGSEFGRAWVSYVQRADSVAAFGFALECLAPFVVRPLSDSPTPEGSALASAAAAVEGGNSSPMPPPPPVVAASGEFDNMNDELMELEMVLQNQAEEEQQQQEEEKDLPSAAREEEEDVVLVVKDLLERLVQDTCSIQEEASPRKRGREEEEVQRALSKRAEIVADKDQAMEETKALVQDLVEAVVEEQALAKQQAEAVVEEEDTKALVQDLVEAVVEEQALAKQQAEAVMEDQALAKQQAEAVVEDLVARIAQEAPCFEQETTASAEQDGGPMPTLEKDKLPAAEPALPPPPPAHQEATNAEILDNATELSKIEDTTTTNGDGGGDGGNIDGGNDGTVHKKEDE